ncbi:MAG: hypothetical protein JWN02_2281 [Acidobacteria bacterium]|nr:hypothetical protein [Acidobacteriota bacterium]
MDQPILSVSTDTTRQLFNLIDKSHSSYMDLNTVVDWEKGIDRSIRPKKSEHSWVYGTPYWDALSEEQRLELLWVENAQIASGFIWLEEGLSPLFIRLLHKHRDHMPQPIYDYMMIFCKEEIVHTQMFRRYLTQAGLPLYQRPEIMQFIEELVNMHPVAGVLCTYLTEGIAEEAAMRQCAADVDPLTARMYMEHHREEVRHLAFGRWICEFFFEKASPETRGKLGYLVRSYMSTVVPQFTYNPEISKYLSFDLGIDPQDAEAVARIRKSPNNERINGERYGPMLQWVKKLGLAPAEYQWLDPVQPMPF